MLSFYYKKVDKEWLCQLLNTLRYRVGFPKKDSPAYTKMTDISKVTGFTMPWLSNFYAGKGI